MFGITPESLTQTVQEFLSEASGAVVLEDGAVTFDLARAKYSISGEYNKCLLHLWSAERNTVRRVLDADEEWDAAVGGDEAGAGASDEAGDLPGARPEVSLGETGGARGV